MRQPPEDTFLSDRRGNDEHATGAFRANIRPDCGVVLFHNAGEWCVQSRRGLAKVIVLSEPHVICDREDGSIVLESTCGDTSRAPMAGVVWPCGSGEWDTRNVRPVVAWCVFWTSPWLQGQWAFR